MISAWLFARSHPQRLAERNSNARPADQLRLGSRLALPARYLLELPQGFDLLLKRRPKDFDVCTSARPDDVRRLFRNSRVIGRRFRLVHVLFGGGKVIETATFRRAPDAEEDRGSEDLLIRNDNVFGAAHEDAMRRDFTINALFYDIEGRQILDWVGGMDDVRRRVVHTIGDPETRFREDPVRILRALKFAGRLDLGITPDVYDAIVFCREALALAARPRLSEEILRLLPPSQYQGRFSVDDREFEGGTVPAGYPVLLLTGAATRDPRAFDRPDDFDIDRPPSVAIGLGHGVHSCLGAALARMESRIAIEELAKRWRRLEVDESGLRRVHMSNVAGYKNVPVTAVR